ncbi:MAG: Gfo/Idh/MocA family oxidoreductase [Treponema sp.]|nr:Gfo/Idh/MocA family oxidoreductase [Treponema sp.]MCL2273014.1 Gfo/Idh/MocA family oxidoreductase [Treponema sp.]
MQRIGIVGIGNISKIYLDNLTGMFGARVKLTSVTDIFFERTEKAAADYQLRAFKTLDEMLGSSDVDIILNITPPNTHFETALAAVKAGKHVYNEKPLCTKREQAVLLLKTANEKNVRVGGAPDTFLGAGLQTCRKVIDEGMIGRPVAATAFMMSHGPEHWHPSPHFFYQDGGGPMFDMGPYYITALVSLLGQVERVCGSAKISTAERTITNQYQNGELINVKIPTHIASVLDFAQGAAATLITSFDVYSHSMPYIEIYGTEGTLNVPDPNTFGGPVKVRRLREENWTEIPLLEKFRENSRGLGITEMAEAIEEDRPHRACAELAFHALDIMHCIHEASAYGKYVKPESRCERPQAFA